jgi:hypothetical protein
MVDVYRNVLEKCDVVSLCKFPHYGVPGHNLHNQIEIEYECNSDEFPYSCMQPLPLLPPAKGSNRGEKYITHFAIHYWIRYHLRSTDHFIVILPAWCSK